MFYENQNVRFLPLQERKEFRKELLKWLMELGGDAFITLNFNCSTNLASARNKLKHFLRMLDRKLIGTNWMKKQDSRTQMVFFPEHIYSNLHYHGYGRLPPNADNMSEKEVAKLIKNIWQSILPMGTTDFQYITYNKHVVPQYASKQVIHHGGAESYILSNEFWPDKQD